MSEDNFDDEFDGSLPSGPRHPMARASAATCR